MYICVIYFVVWVGVIHAHDWVCVCVQCGPSLGGISTGGGIWSTVPQGVLGKKTQIKWRTFAAPLQCPKTGHGWTPAVNRPLAPSLSVSPPLSISLFLCGHVQLTPHPICPLPPLCRLPRAGTQALLTPRVWRREGLSLCHSSSAYSILAPRQSH